MVPFSFENITRSASRDVVNVVPLSDAARAAHESFESHLQRRIGASPLHTTQRPRRHDEPPESDPIPADKNPAEASRQEPVVAGRNADAPPDASETNGRGSARPHDSPEAAPASESAEEHDAEQESEDSTSADEVVHVTIALENPEEANQVLDSEASSEESSVDADDEASPGFTKQSLGKEASELKTQLDTEVEDPDGQAGLEGETSRARQSKLAQGDSTEGVESESLKRIVNASETAAEAESGEVDEHTQVAKPPADDEGARTRNSQTRRGRGENTIASPAMDKPAAPSAKPVAADLIEAAADTAREEQLNQHRNAKDADTRHPVGNDSTATSSTPTRFAQQLLARSADPNGRGVSISDADQSRFIDRVARAVHATGDRGGTLRLRLSPPELGSLTLEVKVQGGAVSARVEADTPAARSLLMENLPLLRERLAEHGMRVDQFDVDLSERHAGETSDGLRQNDQQHEERSQTATSSKEAEDAPRANPHEPTQNGDGQLNIIV